MLLSVNTSVFSFPFSMKFGYYQGKTVESVKGEGFKN